MKTSLEKQCERLEILLQKTGYNRAVFKYLAADSNNERYQPYLEMNSLALNANQPESSVQEFVLKGYNGVVYYSNEKTKEVERALDQVPEEANNDYMMREPVQLDGCREIVEISDQFNSMIGEIDGLNHRLFNTMETLYDAEIQKKQTELLYLKSQINPHFLHNTLEVILGVAYTENAPQTERMIKALSRIFRYSIRGSDTVTVAEGLKIGGSFDGADMTLLWVEDNGTGIIRLLIGGCFGIGWLVDLIQVYG